MHISSISVSIHAHLPAVCQVVHSHWSHLIKHTHTRLTALFPGLPCVSRYQKGKTNLDFTEARDGEWQWLGMHQMPNFRIRPDPDPARSCTIGSGRIRIFTGSRAFGCGRIRIFTGSGCNLIQDQSWIALNEDISTSIQKKENRHFFNWLCCCYMNFLLI